MFSSKREFYFAFGSNMSSRRLQARVPSAKAIGPARLDDYIWTCNKLGKDGTAKANVMKQDGAAVFGVLFSITAKQWKKLDRIESGYHRIPIEVESQEEKISAFTYHSNLITNMPPSEDYVSHIIAGLIEHQLPATYVATIRQEAGI